MRGDWTVRSVDSPEGLEREEVVTYAHLTALRFPGQLSASSSVAQAERQVDWGLLAVRATTSSRPLDARGAFSARRGLGP